MNGVNQCLGSCSHPRPLISYPPCYWFCNWSTQISLVLFLNLKNVWMSKNPKKLSKSLSAQYYNIAQQFTLMYVCYVHIYIRMYVSFFMIKSDVFVSTLKMSRRSRRSRSSSVVESLPFIQKAWVQSSAAPTKALEQGLNLYLLLGPYLDGAPAC